MELCQLLLFGGGGDVFHQRVDYSHLTKRSKVGLVVGEEVPEAQPVGGLHLSGGLGV